MTDELFATDSALREFTAVVTETDPAEGAIALDRTAFFPGGGGQPHDLGEIEHGAQRLPVTRVQRKGDAIWHWVTGALPPPGTEVRGHLDWTRRHALMRTHTALHILCGVVWRDYEAQVTGGNMEPLRGRLDFEFETLEHDLVAEIEKKINIEVQAAREVRVRILPREEAMQVPDLIRTKVNLLPPAL